MFLRNLLLVLFLISAQLSANAKTSRYVNLTSLGTGTNPGLALQLHKNSLNLNLLKASTLRARVRVSKLYTSLTSSSSSFRIDLYDITGGANEFVSTQSLSIPRGASKNGILPIDPGYFASASKTLRFDVYDTQNILVNSFTATINATNTAFQSAPLPAVDETCANSVSGSSTVFGECQLDAFFKRVRFVVHRQGRPFTKVVKGEDGFYTVAVPVPIRNFTGSKNARVKVSATSTSTTLPDGSPITDFGDNLDISSLRVGSSALNTSTLSYDNANNELEFAFVGAANPVASFGANGNLSVPGTISATRFEGIAPVGVANASVDIEGQSSIDVSGLNFIKITDSNTSTVDTLVTITGGVIGQRIMLQLLTDLNYKLDNAATPNTIQWGRGTTAGSTRNQFKDEIFEFMFDGNAWFLIDRHYFVN